MIQLTEKAIYINLPGSAYNVEVGYLEDKWKLYWLERTGNGKQIWTIELNGPHQLLFTDKTIDEEKAKMVVDGNYSIGKFKAYKNYTGKESMFFTATESFQFLLQSKGLTGSNYAIIEKV